MKRTLITITILASLVMTMASCKSTEEEYEDLEAMTKAQVEAATQRADEVLSEEESFEKKLEVFSELKDLEQHKEEAGTNLQVSMQAEIAKLLEDQVYEEAYTKMEGLFKAYSSNENGAKLIEVSKANAKNELEKQDYNKAFEYASRILQVFWDEEGMDLKLTAAQFLVEEHLETENYVEAEEYYMEIFNVISLPGNESLAEPRMKDMERYSEIFRNLNNK